ncbi:hypothetical protein PR048_019662 [Dryococelus australis]|uniref:Uncharacterized protein n=1 Tax=Dryococelus australis TaxID=614101 RepID=A0ABQ9H440_9NEOP|nr:hypothetical protein PR048_019662 [Dryococelus australis]
MSPVAAGEQTPTRATTAEIYRPLRRTMSIWTLPSNPSRYQPHRSTLGSSQKQISPPKTQYRTVMLNCLIEIGLRCPTPQARPREMSSTCLCLLQQSEKQMRPAVKQCQWNQVLQARYRLVPNHDLRLTRTKPTCQTEVTDPRGECYPHVPAAPTSKTKSAGTGNHVEAHM